MNITDQDMADVLNRTLEEIKELKKSNEAEYKVLKTGILCQKLNLNVDDLEKMYNMKIATQA
ncbi:MAG TPA: hypothetical protein EYH01_09875 [Campylobacterales bacterium]|nr:hypothetical protein [Campylobacterales bacterium]HIP60722.1 hypothetical protein [Campylobacterales bacterium]